MTVSGGTLCPNCEQEYLKVEYPHGTSGMVEYRCPNRACNYTFQAPYHGEDDHSPRPGKP